MGKENAPQNPVDESLVKARLELKADPEGLTAYYLCLYSTTHGGLLGEIKLPRSGFNHWRKTGIQIINV